MGQVRVRAVANVMGLRRGDEGDVETGGTHVDAMINAGYLEVIEYLPDPIPLAEPAPVEAVQFAHPNSFLRATVVGLPEEVTPPKEASDGKRNSSKGKPAASRRRSSAPRRPARNAGDDPDVRPSVGDSTSGHGEPTGSAPDEQAGGEA